MIVALIAVALPAQAQVSPVSPSPEPAYVDRVLEGGPQVDARDDAERYNDEGWARSLKLEYGMVLERGAAHSSTRTLSFEGFLDTPNHGAWSAGGSLIGAPSDGQGLAPGGRAPNSSTWHIEQRGLPLEGGWSANHRAGDIGTGTPTGAGGISRVTLPSTPIAGVGGQWFQEDRVDLQLAAGRPGLFSGIQTDAFALSPGSIVTGGGQWRIAGDRTSASRFDAGVALADARGVAEAGVPEGRSTRAVWSSLAWEGAAPWGSGLESGSRQVTQPTDQRPGGLRLLGSWLHNTGNLDKPASGTWIDAAWNTGWLQNAVGIFSLDPGLRWGPAAVASDLRGLYWRADTATRRWQLGWSTEWSDSISGLSGASGYGSVFGRYRLDTRNAVGGTLALRSGQGAAQSVQLNWDRTSDLGQTQWRTNFTRTEQTRSEFVGVDQAWGLSMPGTLATSLGWERSRSSAVVSSWTWGLLYALSPFSGLSLDASLRGASGGATSSLNANLGGVWQFDRNWSLSLRYSASRGQDPQAAQVVSALTAASQLAAAPASDLRTLQLVLRFEERAGTSYAPLGGIPGSGAGRLTGTVYFDADANGRRDAAEAGAPNITIVLDRRFVTRTDANGRYEFPAVAAGEHELQIQSDNVPLPWSPVAREPVRMHVLVRGTAVEDFALQKVR